jgi:HSP20 family protein
MLTRWNPMRDFVTFDRLFNNFWTGSNTFWPDTLGSGPAMDIKETDQAFILHAEVPGFSPEQIDVHVENGVLFLKGHRQVEEQGEGQYHLRERQTVSFQRAFTLPVPVDVDKAQAEFDNGILTLTLPKSQEALPKKISITPKQQIAAKSQS